MQENASYNNNHKTIKRIINNTNEIKPGEIHSAWKKIR